MTSQPRAGSARFSGNDQRTRRSTVVDLDEEDHTTSCVEALQTLRQSASSRYADVARRLSDFRKSRRSFAHQRSTDRAPDDQGPKQWLTEKWRRVIHKVSPTTARLSEFFSRMTSSYSCTRDGGAPEVARNARRLSFWHDVVGELIGTFFLVVIGCGSSIQHGKLQDHEHDLRVALAFGLTYASCVYCLRRGTNGHFNPVITLAMMASGRFDVSQCLIFIPVQFVGAVSGAAFLGKVTDAELVVKGSLGCTLPGDGVSSAKALFVECFSTMIFVFFVFAGFERQHAPRVSSDKNRDEEEKREQSKLLQASRPSSASFVSGTALIAISLMAMPYSGSGLNTARSFGPALVSNIWTSHWIYWFGTITGGLAGGFLHDLSLLSTSATFRTFQANMRCRLNIAQLRRVSELEELEERRAKTSEKTSWATSLQSTKAESLTAMTNRNTNASPRKISVSSPIRTTTTKTTGICQVEHHRRSTSCTRRGTSKSEVQPILSRSVSYHSALRKDDCPSMKSSLPLRCSNVVKVHDRYVMTENHMPNVVDAVDSSRLYDHRPRKSEEHQMRLSLGHPVDDEGSTPINLATFDTDVSIDDESAEVLDSRTSMFDPVMSISDKTPTTVNNDLNGDFSFKKSSIEQVHLQHRVMPGSDMDQPEFATPVIALVEVLQTIDHFACSAIPTGENDVTTVREVDVIGVGSLIKENPFSTGTDCIGVEKGFSQTLISDEDDDALAVINSRKIEKECDDQPIIILPSEEIEAEIPFAFDADLDNAIVPQPLLSHMVANNNDDECTPMTENTEDNKNAMISVTSEMMADGSVYVTADPPLQSLELTTIVTEVESMPTEIVSCVGDKINDSIMSFEQLTESSLRQEIENAAAFADMEHALLGQIEETTIIKDTDSLNCDIGCGIVVSNVESFVENHTGIDDTERSKKDDELATKQNMEIEMTTISSSNHALQFSMDVAPGNLVAGCNWVNGIPASPTRAEAAEDSCEERNYSLEIGIGEKHQEVPTAANDSSPEESTVACRATSRLTSDQVREVTRLVGGTLDYLDDCSPLGGAMPESDDSSADEL